MPGSATRLSLHGADGQPLACPDSGQGKPVSVCVTLAGWPGSGPVGILALDELPFGRLLRRRRPLLTDHGKGNTPPSRPSWTTWCPGAGTTPETARLAKRSAGDSRPVCADSARPASRSAPARRKTPPKTCRTGLLDRRHTAGADARREPSRRSRNGGE